MNFWNFVIRFRKICTWWGKLVFFYSYSAGKNLTEQQTFIHVKHWHFLNTPFLFFLTCLRNKPSNIFMAGWSRISIVWSKSHFFLFYTPYFPVVKNYNRTPLMQNMQVVKNHYGTLQMCHKRSFSLKFSALTCADTAWHDVKSWNVPSPARCCSSQTTVSHKQSASYLQSLASCEGGRLCSVSTPLRL